MIDAFAGLADAAALLAFDRRQRGTFRRSFEDYVATRVTTARIARGKQMLQRHAAMGASAQRFGVPPQVIVAIWGWKAMQRADLDSSVYRSAGDAGTDCRRICFQWRLKKTLWIVKNLG